MRFFEIVRIWFATNLEGLSRPLAGEATRASYGRGARSETVVTGTIWTTASSRHAALLDTTTAGLVLRVSLLTPGSKRTATITPRTTSRLTP